MAVIKARWPPTIVMPGLKREAGLRAGCPGHPPSLPREKQAVEGGDKPGHDAIAVRSAKGSDAMNIQGNSRYHEVHARSLADPQGFWGEAAGEIDWIEPAKKVFDSSMGLYGRWFPG